MNYLIFSDSHGRGSYLREALDRQITPPDGIFFAGDGLRDLDAPELLGFPIWAVAGNCDWMSLEEGERLVQTGGVSCLLTHGHLYGVKSGYGRLLARGASLGVDVIVFGHTHLPHCEQLQAGTTVGSAVLQKSMYLFNPGSIAQGSFGTLTVRGGQILLSHGSI